MVRCLARLQICLLTIVISHDVDTSEDDDDEDYDTEEEDLADLYRIYAQKYGCEDLSGSAEYDDEDIENIDDVEGEYSPSNCDYGSDGDDSEGSEDESDAEDEDSAILSNTTVTEGGEESHSESGDEEDIDSPHSFGCAIDDPPSLDLSEVENEYVSRHMILAFTEYL